MDLNNMMGSIKEMQEKMKKAQEELVHIRVTEESGAGMVKATANGHKQIVDLEIDESLLKPDDREMLQDLTIAAVNKAIQSAEEAAKEEMKKSMGGMMPNIPGLDLSRFM